MIELLSTKSFIPRPRKKLVSRPRLVERLNQGMNRKLPLIAAPTGFGKTTLLSEWNPHGPRCVTWFSRNEGDNDIIRFWAYFISSLQAPRTPPLPSILTTLIDDITGFPDKYCFFPQETKHGNLLVKVLALHALAYNGCEEQGKAFDILEHAMNLSEPEGYIRACVDEGEPMRNLLLDYQTIIKKRIGGANVSRKSYT